MEGHIFAIAGAQNRYRYLNVNPGLVSAANAWSAEDQDSWLNPYPRPRGNNVVRIDCVSRSRQSYPLVVPNDGPMRGHS